MALLLRDCPLPSCKLSARMFGYQKVPHKTFEPVRISATESSKIKMSTIKKETYWAHVDLATVPYITVTPPGPESKALHARCTKYFKGLSSQVKLFPVAFESGLGCTLQDVDGNRYIDF